MSRGGGRRRPRGPWHKFSCWEAGPAPRHLPPLLHPGRVHHVPAASGGGSGPNRPWRRRLRPLGGRRVAVAAGRREEERSEKPRGPPRQRQRLGRGGGARAEQSGAGPAPSLRLGAPAGLSQRCPRWGRGTRDRREKDPPDNPETAKLPRDPYKERHPRREICSWVDPNSRNAPRHSS